MTLLLVYMHNLASYSGMIPRLNVIRCVNDCCVCESIRVMLAIPALKLQGIQRILTSSKSCKDFSDILNLESMLDHYCKMAIK